MNKEKEYKVSKFYLLILIVIALWVISWIITDNLYLSVTERGAFGDKFGFINSLFSGIALVGIIYSIFLQQKELSLQRTELKETKEEFKDQNFQTTFFNLLKTQNQIANDISARVGDLKSYNKEEYKEISGRNFFNHSKSQLLRIDKALSSDKFYNYSKWSAEDDYLNAPRNIWEEEDLTKSMKISFTFKYYKIDEEMWKNSKKLNPIERAERLYAIFFNKFHFVIGHYFRHIYHILLFLEETEKEKLSKTNQPKEKERIKKEFKQFAEFIQSQMSTPELFLLFYNALSFPKLQRLLIKYNTLENLTIEDLLNKEHNVIEGINLKSRTELLS